ncbi:MAG: hypothetical protein O8C66_11085 [Candidatus Methanoperedens sp.]|nr:hypothetical protein [Candidatus Methanoperedens sp.]MCZ7371043.1 hypothetical protein [Candidatus Methanoperedens sp.]
MKVREVLQEFIPCEVCGNRDIKNFYFHVFVHQGFQPYVKCCECEEEYYSTKARSIITRIEDLRKAKAHSSLNHKNAEKSVFRKQEYGHPLLKTLSQI